MAIINASGDLRGGPPNMFEEAMKKALARGYRFVVVDLFNNEGLDERGIGDFFEALKVLFSSDQEAEFDLVKHRDSLEQERGLIINWNWFMYERSYYNRQEAIEGLRRRAVKG